MNELRTIHTCKLQFQLEESHKDLYQWFLLHQECLLLNEDLSALAAFEAFAAYFSFHIDFENKYLLGEGGVMMAGLRWSVAVYQKEHDKLLGLLNHLRLELDAYLLLMGRQKRLALLDVLANQQTFRKVVEHHELREEQDLFRHLTGVDRCLQAWQISQLELNEKYQPLKECLKTLLSSR